ncbi:nucleotidyltransferase domain-containing protein [Acetivibrio cellulolyticus]|uniref:nucleotidyltransferase domain-containing protein n=1 Tax=Acetivibrio cellulolyticus TaxID=35830 RepID=UPI0001E2D4F6|nr:nucleotidyltransferase family protein [Acetivibrio cellulolyticus]
MDKNSQYFIALLNAFLKDTMPAKPIDVDWGKVYDLASMHSLSGAVYLPIQKLENTDKPELSILNKFKSDFFYATLRYEEQEKVYQKIAKKLSDDRIEHLFFKGVVIREYYPVKQMRTLGDIDFLLHKKDQEAFKKFMTRMGFKNTSSEQHEKYEKGKIIIEAHDKLISNKINSKVDYSAYFENAWDYAIAKENGYTYELNMEYHLVFLLTHLAKHFYELGAGVRMILDIAVILQKFGDVLNFSFIWKELKEIKLDIFAQNVFVLCDRWFQVKNTGTALEVDEFAFNVMTNYILDGGTFGFCNNQAIRIIKREYVKVDNHKLPKFRTFWRKIFLDFDEMSSKYPILGKLPFLLPFASVHRWFKCIIKKRSRTIKILKTLLTFTWLDEVEKSTDMMKKIGL